MARASLDTLSRAAKAIIAGTNYWVATVKVDTGDGTALTAGKVLYYDSSESNYKLYSTTDVSDETLDTGDGSTKVFEGFAAHGLIERGSFTVTATIGGSDVTLSDDGNGKLADSGGNHKGYIDYDSGYYRLEFGTAPDNGEAITADYTYRAGKAAAILLEDVPASESNYPAAVLVWGVANSDNVSPTVDAAIKEDLKGSIVFV